MQDRPLTAAHYIILFVLTLIPLVMAMIVLPFLPDTIPVHFDLNGNVNRWGSRYESLVLPAIAAATGLFMIWVTKFVSSKDDWAARMMFWISVGTMIFLIAITAVVLYMFYSNS